MTPLLSKQHQGGWCPTGQNSSRLRALQSGSGARPGQYYQGLNGERTSLRRQGSRRESAHRTVSRTAGFANVKVDYLLSFGKVPSDVPVDNTAPCGW